MTTIEEILDTRGTSYTVTREGGPSETVSITYTHVLAKALDTFVFRGKDLRILMEPSLFLTYELAWEARNTALQAANALKVLMSFCFIIQIPFEALNIEQARTFMAFMRGTLSEGATHTYKLLTNRGEGTVGVYLSHIRRYARWLGTTNSPFLQPKNSIMQTTRTVNPLRSESYRLRANVVVPKEAPQYISVGDYRATLDTIDRSWGIEERCIVRLMYEHGLRIGEVLGLTIEDLEQKEGADGLLTYAVVLRNRTSDKNDQHAKTLMRVTDKRQYESADYKRRGLGTQRVYISESLFFEICEYVELTFSEEVEDGCHCLADSVSGEEPNRYLFVNTKGHPLSQNLWNKRLRKILEESGIHVDKGSRRTNLNHRFRHGYAMFLTHEATNNGRPIDDFAVMTLMRHKSPNSTAVYLNPTDEDVARMQKSIVDPLWERVYARLS